MSRATYRRDLLLAADPAVRAGELARDPFPLWGRRLKLLAGLLDWVPFSPDEHVVLSRLRKAVEQDLALVDDVDFRR